jgi:hypothetical protein
MAEYKLVLEARLPNKKLSEKTVQALQHAYAY